MLTTSILLCFQVCILWYLLCKKQSKFKMVLFINDFFELFKILLIGHFLRTISCHFYNKNQLKTCLPIVCSSFAVSMVVCTLFNCTSALSILTSSLPTLSSSCSFFCASLSNPISLPVRVNWLKFYEHQFLLYRRVCHFL